MYLFTLELCTQQQIIYFGLFVHVLFTFILQNTTYIDN